MKTLPLKVPTPEQLLLISNPRPGVQLIRGAAGSGKTTTALLMLNQLSSFWLRRRERQNLPDKIHVLVLTFNRTLKGYIQELAERQIHHPEDMELTVSTFAKWSREFFPNIDILKDEERQNKIKDLSFNVPLPPDFAIDEVDYLLGRFLSNQLIDYVGCKRVGRGLSPRIDRNLRQELLEKVVYPYELWKSQINRFDWNDLAVWLSKYNAKRRYEIIVADEAQDFSANQARAIMNFAADPSSIVFVLDAAQRIYPRGFAWAEAGVPIRQSYRLKENHRNTKEICQFAAPLLDGLDISDDGTFPDLHSCKNNGPRPIVLNGLYSQQVNFVLNYIHSYVNLSEESVAFLKPCGGRWFAYLRDALRKNSLEFVELTRKAEWPTGPENIALSTMHSAKGLEFDHVVILGLCDKVTPHGNEQGDTAFENWRRILAMAITRARKSVIVGYKPGEASSLTSLFNPATYREESL